MNRNIQSLALTIIPFLLIVAQVLGGNNKNDECKTVLTYANMEEKGFPMPPPSPPSNDDPCNAIALPVNNSCVASVYSNDDATDSGIGDPGCGSYSGGDVWFSFTVPAEGEVSVRVWSPGTEDWMDEPEFAVYGGTCGSLSLLACNNTFTTEVISGRTPGETLFVRVWEANADTDGDFRICVHNDCVGLTADAGTGGDECDMDFVLQASLSTGAGTWTKSSGIGNASFSPNNNDPNATVTVDAYGTYEFTWTEINGTCSKDSTITVNFYEQPVADAGVGGEECDLDYLLAATLSSGIGTWSKVSGPGNANFTPGVNDPNAVANVDIYGVYEFEWTEVNGSCSDRDTITVDFNEIPTGANAGADVEASCNLLSAGLAGTSHVYSGGANDNTGSFGLWAYVSGPDPTPVFSDVNSPVSSVIVTSYGSYVLEWIESNGTCEVRDSVRVDFYQQPVANAGSGGNECDLSYDLAATPSVGTGAWTKVSGPGLATFSPDVNDPNATVTVDAYGSYDFQWTEVNGTCNDQNSVTVNFFQQPLANAGSNAANCDLDYQLQAVASFGTGTWAKLSGPGTVIFSPDANESNAIATVDSYGIYEFEWTEITGTCIDRDTVEIEYSEQPIANAGAGGDECDLDFTLQATPSVGGGTWSKISGAGTPVFTPNANDPNATVAVDVYDSYEFVWTEVNGSCSDKDTVVVNFYELPVANAGGAGDECDLSFTFSAVASVGTGTWTKSSGAGTPVFTPNANDPNATVTVDLYGTYEFVWTEVNGSCSDVASVTVNFYEQPIANAGAGGDECDLDYSFSALPSVGVGTWSKISGSGTPVFTPNANDPNATVSVDAYDSYEFVWTEANGTCSSTDTIDVSFYEQPIANAGSGGDECDLNFTFSAVPSTGVGSWTMISGAGPVSFSPNSNAPNAKVTASVYGSYQFVWAEVNGSCADSDTIAVGFTEQPIANAGSGGEMCGSQFQLSAVSGGGVGTWTQKTGPGTSSFLPDANDPNATVSVDLFGTYQYTWTEVNGLCSDSSTIQVDFYEQPIANPGSGGDNCNLNFVLNAIPSTGNGTWTLLSGPGLVNFVPNENASNATIIVDEYGVYKFQWEEVNQSCSDTATINVNFFQQPVANAGTGGSECDLEYTLSAVASVGPGTWTKKSGPGSVSFSPNENDPNATATVDEYGDYEFTWTEINGICTDNDLIAVKFTEKPVANAGPGGSECDLDYTLAAVSSVGTGTWTKKSGPGSVSFSPNGNDPNANVIVDEYGVYEFIWTEVNGACSQKDSLIVAFHEQPIANAGTGGNECDLVFELSASPSKGIGTWSQKSGTGTAVFSPDANSPNAMVTVDVDGDYEFTWTETNEVCVSEESISVSFNTQPIANAGSGGNACGLNFDLAAEPSVGSGVWSVTSGSGGVIFSPDASDPNSVVTVDAYGAYEFTWTETNGTCVSSGTVNVEFTEQPVADAGTNGNACELKYTLQAKEGAGSGTWTQIGGNGTSSFLPDPNTPDATVTVDTYGKYEFTWTLENGSCMDAQTVEINFYQQPEAFAGIDVAECDLDFTLSAQPSHGVGTWLQTSGPGVADFTPNVNNPDATVTVDAYGDYQFTWTEENGTCKSEASIKVEFSELPHADAGPDEYECDLEYELQALPAVGVGVWQKKSGPGTVSFLPNKNDPNAKVLVDSYGAYEFEWTVSNRNCVDVSLVQIQFLEQPRAYAGLDQEIDQKNQARLQADLSVFKEGEWKVITGSGVFEDRFSNTTLVSELSLGENVFRWTESNEGCNDSDEVRITMNRLFLPSVITPNGDTKNDYFIVNGIQNLGPSELVVFNREGAEVYRSEDYRNNWDGKDHSGNNLSRDTYFYVLRLGTGKVYKGYVVVQR